MLSNSISGEIRIILADWTYFEFVWDFPGTIPGWGNTAMWYANRDSAYVDDIYYGEWFDGVYNGEEPFGFINGDFEKSDLGAEWGVNISPGGIVGSHGFYFRRKSYRSRFPEPPPHGL